MSKEVEDLKMLLAEIYDEDVLWCELDGDYISDLDRRIGNACADVIDKYRERVKENNQKDK